MGNTILIVDDDPRSLKLFRDLLQASGYTVIQAADGQEAVALAQSRKPDLVLMDVRLPGMDGMEATRAIKRHPDTRHIPVVAVTGEAMEKQREAILQAGCDDYIAKPVEFATLLRTVDAYMSGARHGEESQDPGR